MCFIVPSYLVKNILVNGDEEQQNEAVSMLRSMHQVGKEQLKALLFSLNKKIKFPDVSYLNKEIFGGGAMERFVYSSEHKMDRSGKLVRKEGQEAVDDKLVDKAYEGSGHTYEFFKKYFNRNSIDDDGMEMKSTVHFGRKYNNAFWDGRAMYYGCGDGKIFTPFALCIDVISHEQTHGITQHEAGLIYYGQSGALNEHMSDVFGVLVKQEVLGHTAETSDWLIGQGLFAKGIKGKALRDMASPGQAFDDPIIGKDRQVWHMKDWKEIDDDAGGVHLFSGIPNKAFHTAAMELGGKVAPVLGKIWYQTLCEELKPTSQFKDMVEATLKVATKLHGADSKEVKAVRSGWLKVGLL